jgi:MFS family permease
MNMVNPFIGAYAVGLGASSSEMGWFQSSANISNNVLQVLWGKLSDRLCRRVPFLVLGNLIIMAFWVPMMFVTNATQLIVLVAVQALLGSMATPTWVALIGDLVPSTRLGRVNASLSLWASFGSLVATLVSGFIMINIGGTLQQMFLIPFAVAILCGLVSALVMVRVKERRVKDDQSKSPLADILSVFTRAKASPDFLKFSFAGAVFNFFMSIAWPLFSITLVRVLRASMWEIALLTAVQLAVTIIFQIQMGKLADSLGRKPLLVAFRFSLVTVPLGYAFAPNVYFLILLECFWGVSLAVGQASMTAYLLDVTPEEHRGSFAAFHNLLIGVTSFIGSLVGGYLTDFTISLLGLVLGLQIVYLVSAFGRGAGATMYLSLRETLEKDGGLDK